MSPKREEKAGAATECTIILCCQSASSPFSYEKINLNLFYNEKRTIVKLSLIGQSFYTKPFKIQKPLLTILNCSKLTIGINMCGYQNCELALIYRRKYFFMILMRKGVTLRRSYGSEPKVSVDMGLKQMKVIGRRKRVLVSRGHRKHWFDSYLI